MAETKNILIDIDSNAEEAAQEILNLKSKLGELELEASKTGVGTDRFKALQSEIKTTESRVTQLTGSYKRLTQASQSLKAQQDKTNTSQSKFNNTAGQANAVLQQSGFLMSDVAYGFQGIGNNISAITGQFGNLVASSGGFVSALKSVGAAMMGPAGIIFAIQSVVGLLQTVDFGKKKAEEAKISYSEARAELQKWLQEVITVTGGMDNIGIVIAKTLKNIPHEELNKMGKEAYTTYEDLLDLALRTNADLEKQGIIFDKLTEKEKERLRAVYRVHLRNENAGRERLKSLTEEGEAFTSVVQTLKAGGDLTGEQLEKYKDFVVFTKRAYGDAQIGGGEVLDVQQTINNMMAAGLKTQRELVDATAESEENIRKSGEAFEKTVKEILPEQYKRDQQNLEILQKQLAIAEKNRDTIPETTEEYKKLDKVVLELEKKIEAITGKKQRKGGAGVTVIKDYLAGLLDLSKTIEQANAKRATLESDNDRDRLKIRQASEIRTIENTYNEFERKEKQRLENYLKNTKLTAKQRKDAETESDKAIADAKVQTATAVQAVEMKNAQELFEFELDLVRKLTTERLRANAQEAQAQRTISLAAFSQGTRAGGIMQGVGAEGIEQQLDAEKKLYDAQEQVLMDRNQIRLRTLQEQGASELDLKNTQLAMDMELTANRAKFEIDQENKIVEAKRNINQEYVNWFSQLGNIFSQIAGENEDLANAGLLLEQGAAIANVVINTNAANAQITNETTKEAAGYDAAAGVYSALGPAGVAPAAAMKALSKTAIGKGVARKTKNWVNAGLSIAAIGATTLSSWQKAGDAGSGGTGGGNVARPQFNVLGSTGQNQLASALASQTDKPVKAYVVSSEITSQQALDRTIKTTATID